MTSARVGRDTDAAAVAPDNVTRVASGLDARSLPMPDATAHVVSPAATAHLPGPPATGHVAGPEATTRVVGPVATKAARDPRGRGHHLTV